MKKIICLLTCLLFVFPAISSAAEPILTKNRIKQVIDNGGNFMINNIDSSGHFTYEIHPFFDSESDDDNIVRQAGALFVLGELLRTFNEEKYLDAIKKSWPYFRNQISFDSRNGTEVAFVNDSQRSSTGTNALLLIGLIEVAKKDEVFEKENKKYIDGLINLLFFMQKESGGIRGYYNPEFQIGDRVLEKESDYYNGEGLLALIRIVEYKNTEESKNKALKSYKYFYAIYSKKPTTPFYLWAMLALKDFATIFPEGKDEYTNFAILYTDWVLSEKMIFHPYANNGYMLEGIGSTVYLASSSNDAEIRKKSKDLMKMFYKRLRQLQGWQIDSRSYLSMNYNNQVDSEKNASEKSFGCFLNSKKDLKCRIDSTQHALSAYRLLWLIFDK